MGKFKTSTGIILEVVPVPKLMIQSAFMSLPEPEVPKVFIESQDRWIENPFDPNYEIALANHQMQKSDLCARKIVELGVSLSDASDIRDADVRSLSRSKFSEGYDMSTQRGIEIAFIELLAIQDPAEYGEIAKLACVTEEEVGKHVDCAGVMRNGTAIHKASMQNGFNSGIQMFVPIIGNTQLVNAAEEYRSCIESNLDWDAWFSGKYDVGFMAATVAMNRVKRMEEAHSNDASQSEAKKRAKTKGNN